MKKKKSVFYLLIFALVLLEFVFLHLSYKSFVNAKDVVVDDVSLKENNIIHSNKSLAIMIEQENGEYVESTSSSWPTGMYYNEDLSGCMDTYGNTLVNVLKFDNATWSATVTTDTTAYCYLFFDITRPMGDYLINYPSTGSNPPIKLNSSIEGGMYRYQGVQTDSSGVTINNYICFGTRDKNECITDEEHHMYRIIGITEDGRIKVIKKTSIGEYQWWTDYTTNIPWYQETGNRSKLYTALNGSDFLGNSEYVPGGWESLIADTSWKYGDFTNRNQAASAIYATEEAWTNKVTSKIGLMYVADYYYSQQVGGKNCAYEQGEAVYSTCTYGWMHLKQNDTNLPADNSNNAYYPSAEWTMSRYGQYGDGIYNAYYVITNGNIGRSTLTRTYSVRPVFYLKSDVQYISGTGTLSDPYIIR